MQAQMVEQQRAAAPQQRSATAADAAPAAASAVEATLEATAARPGFDETDRSTWGDPGRNDLCPCGSGQKFKHCHGKF